MPSESGEPSDTSSRLHQSLTREIDSLLEQNGLRMPHSVIAVEGAEQRSLDLTDIVIDADVDEARQPTLVHVHRPPTVERYFRQTSYAVWNDGRVAELDIPTSDMSGEAATIEIEAARRVVIAELNKLHASGTITRTQKQDLGWKILAEVAAFQASSDTALELSTGEPLTNESISVQGLIEYHARRPSPGSRDLASYPELYQAMSRLHEAQAATVLVEEEFQERYTQDLKDALERAEHEPETVPVMSPQEVWDLIELLEKARESGTIIE